MEIEPTPETLACSECGEEVGDMGYLPATERDDVYRPMADAFLCGACGFNQVGAAGCAPEIDEVIDPNPDDVLLHVRVADDIDVLTVKD